MMFREIYPNGTNYCFTPYSDIPYVLGKNGLKIKYIGALDQMCTGIHLFRTLQTQ